LKTLKISLIALILIFALIGLLNGCNDKPSPEIQKLIEQYRLVDNLRTGDTLHKEMFEDIGCRLHQSTESITTFKISYAYYVTVDPKTNIIKSIWVGN
jgi:hypothetical protein